MPRREKLDLRYAQAMYVFPLQAKKIRVKVIGLGGTGSMLAALVTRCCVVLRATGKDITLTFIDPDKVEENNLPRQNFFPSEIGRYKAEVLAERNARAFGMEISCLPVLFTPDLLQSEWNALTILVGCVDNAAARQAMNQVLKMNNSTTAIPHVWWLDAGNELDHGQVLFGSTVNKEVLKQAFTLGAFPCCSMLPSPLLQEPQLGEPRLEEVAEQNLSCAQQLVANAQSLTINSKMAVEVVDYFYRFLVTGKLRKFATYLDADAGTMSSRYCTPQDISQVLDCKSSFFLKRAVSTQR